MSRFEWPRLPPAAGEPVKLLMLDDHALFRAGVRGLLEREWPGVEVREAGSLEEALDLCTLWPAQLALVDISLKGADGIQFVSRVHEQTPAPRQPPACVMLSMHTGEGYVRRALEAGALGFVVKDAEPRELLAAATAALAGQTYVSPVLAAGVLGRGGRPAPETVLSPRQLEVFRLAASGLSTKLIARKLGLSVRTVDAHRREIAFKLDLHDVASWVHFAVRHGLAMETRS